MATGSRYHEVALEELAHEAQGATQAGARDGSYTTAGSRNSSSVAREADDLSLSIAGTNDDGTINSHSGNSLSQWGGGSTQWNAPLETHPRPRDDDSLTTGTMNTAGSRKISLTSLIAQQDGERVIQRIQRHPRSVRHRHAIQLNGKETRAHPLHHVVSLNPPVAIVDTMIEFFPEACRLPDRNFGQLPLHIAANFRADTVVLKSLLKAFPEAVKLTDAGQRLPLHYACHDGDPGNISVLLEADRSGLTAKDFYDKTPVDMCRASQSPHRDAVLKHILGILDGSAPTAPASERSPIPSQRDVESTTVVQEKGESSLESRKSHAAPDPQEKKKNREASSQPRLKSREESIDLTDLMAGNDESEVPPAESTPTASDTKRKKKPRRKSFGNSLKNLTHRSRKSADGNMDHSTNSASMFSFLGKKSESDITDHSNSSMNSRLGESFSSFNSRLGESFSNMTKRPMLDAKPPRKNDEMDSALIPWIASGAEIVAPTRGTALSIRRPRAQSVEDLNHQSMSAVPRSYKRGSSMDSEKGHKSLSALSYSQPDAIDTNLVKDGYSGYIEHTKADEDNSIKKGHLKRRRAALVEELKRAHENIKLKREKADKCQSNMDQMGIKVQELIEAIEKERTSMDFAKSAIRSNEEIAAQHEENIRKCDEEMAALGLTVDESLDDEDSLNLSEVFSSR